MLIVTNVLKNFEHFETTIKTSNIYFANVLKSLKFQIKD